MAKKKEFDLKQIEDLASQLVSEENIARLVGFNATYWYEVKKNNPEISEALKRGRARSEKALAARLLQLAFNPENMNPAAVMFALKCRHQWREIHEIEVSGSIDHNHQLEEAESRKARIAELQKKLIANKDVIDVESED